MSVDISRIKRRVAIIVVFFGLFSVAGRLPTLTAANEPAARLAGMVVGLVLLYFVVSRVVVRVALYRATE